MSSYGQKLEATSFMQNIKVKQTKMEILSCHNLSSKLSWNWFGIYYKMIELSFLENEFQSVFVAVHYLRITQSYLKKQLRHEFAKIQRLKNFLLPTLSRVLLSDYFNKTLLK